MRDEVLAKLFKEIKTIDVMNGKRYYQDAETVP